ncbi:MAG TPA: hypothetical protein VLM11_13975 [Streptosporangiaceae bacterium]|nr:hypothetical protein [Streptosporangiaceae bacterium]
MSHDKIRAAARKRMAETGEPYAVARREVIREHEVAAGESPRPGATWFAISYSKAATSRLTAWLGTTLFGGGPGRAGVEVNPDQIRVRMDDFTLTVPRSSIRWAARSQDRLRGTTGVHAGRGQLLVNGSADGLVKLAIEPPCYTGRTLSTMFVRERVSSIIVSLDDPDGFIATVGGESPARMA